MTSKPGCIGADGLHRATSVEAGGLAPTALARSLGVDGAYIGRDRFGVDFFFDPFDLYRHGVITNPNLLVVGQIGRGKSSLIKSYLFRLAMRGHRAAVLDPKGEYGPLAEALTGQVVRLRPGCRAGLNPLAGWPPGPAGRAKVLELAKVAVQSGLSRPLSTLEQLQLESAIDGLAVAAQPPSLPALGRALAADSASREVVAGLRRLLAGDLAEIFDGCGPEALDTTSPVVVLDLSSLYSSPSLGVAMSLALPCLEAGFDQGSGWAGATLVIDEAWAIMEDAATAGWLRASWKLARARGTSYVAVIHRFSDLLSAGGPDPRHQLAVRGLAADSETKVILGQDVSEMSLASSFLNLNSRERAVVPSLGKGVALWKVGGRSFLVQNELSPGELPLVATDQAMAAGTRGRC